MTAVLPDSARELIESGRLAHCVTIDPDGRPQLSVVWVGLDGDEIVSGHLGEFRKIRNLRRDPRIALSMEADTSNVIGMRHCLVVQGRARVTEGGAADLLQRLAYRYVGPGVKFPPFDDPPPGFVIHIAVERVGGLGPWNPGPMS